MNKTEICNYALTLIGEKTVTDAETPQNEQGRLISLLFDQTFHEMLMEFDFAFATNRTTLAASSTDPSFGYETQYEMPDDWLRMAEDKQYEQDGELVIEYSVTIDDNYDTPLNDWKIENGYLMTNGSDSDDQIQIVYIKKLNTAEDIGKLKPHAVKLLAHELGWKLLLKRSQNLKQHQMFAEQLRQARLDAWGAEAKNCFRDKANNRWQQSNR